jgi:hypothetical protein
VNLTPGDIVASEGSSFSSRLIQIFTRSRWSHVGIVTGSEKILEATKSGNGKDVREVSLSEFMEGAKAVAIFHRKPQLDESGINYLRDRGKQFLQSKYSVEQAVFSNYLPTILAFMWIYFGYPTYLICDYLIKNYSDDAGVLVALQLLAIILVFWVFLYLLFAFTSKYKCQWGVKTMQRLYKKTRLGRMLLERQQDTFCSKLVALIDSEVGGMLVCQSSTAESYRPVDIVLACQKMKWERTYLKEPKRNLLLRRALSFWLRS